MKPQKLSTKSNPLGENMNLQEAFNQLKKEEHNASFENLGNWLDQNSKKPNTMKNIYKIAASFIFATMILIACTVPVQQEEEIGYMIKGIAEIEATQLKAKFANLSSIKSSQISISDLIYEQEEGGEESISKFSEVVMVLAEANHSEAVDMADQLKGIFEFSTIDIMPIEDTVERTIFESALNKFDIKVEKEIPDSVLARRIDQFLHQNSSMQGTSNIFTDENGDRYVELIIEGRLNEESKFQIKTSNDANANLKLKQGIETLHQDLTGKIVVGKLDSLSMNELEIMELKERKKKEENE